MREITKKWVNYSFVFSCGFYWILTTNTKMRDDYTVSKTVRSMLSSVIETIAGHSTSMEGYRDCSRDVWCIERLRGQKVKVKLQPPTRLFSVKYNLTTFSGTSTLAGVAWRVDVTETGHRDHLQPECLTTLLLRFIFNSPKKHNC